jgi:alanine racemase
MNPTYAEIKLNNLTYNFNTIRRKTKTKVMAVVKADAYGHGMLECVRALSKLKNKPEYYGVALYNEAIELRNSKIISEPILCFSPFQKELISEYSKKYIIPSITTIQHISQLLKLNSNQKLKIHIKINTGMNRLGINYDKAVEHIQKLRKKSNIEIDGIYTHFATSDEKDKKFAQLQLVRFQTIVNTLKEKNIKYGLAHAANSGAIIDMPNSYFDMVRPGISLYGYYPSLETSESIRLKPVMNLFSKLSTTNIIEKGETVGYGRLFLAKNKTFIGTIPIGYADGLSRGLSNNIDVIINNKSFKQIGRISMDRIVINFEKKRITAGAKVILLGKSKNISIDAWDWAKLLNTIPYEITCGISKRVPRKFV